MSLPVILVVGGVLIYGLWTDKVVEEHREDGLYIIKTTNFGITYEYKKYNIDRSGQDGPRKEGVYYR